MWETEYYKFKEMKDGPDKLAYAIRMLVHIRMESNLEYIKN